MNDFTLDSYNKELMHVEFELEELIVKFNSYSDIAITLNQSLESIKHKRAFVNQLKAMLIEENNYE